MGTSELSQQLKKNTNQAEARQTFHCDDVTTLTKSVLRPEAVFSALYVCWNRSHLSWRPAAAFILKGEGQGFSSLLAGTGATLARGAWPSLPVRTGVGLKERQKRAAT